MDTKVPLAGSYLKEGNSYFPHEGFHRLVLASRPPKGNRPTTYIVLKPCCGETTLPDGSRERYVSGIFWIADNTGRIDFQGQRYTVKVGHGCLQISQAGGRGKVL